ncbi:zinc finger protein 316-like [Apodemus sylvaticus]|uniref:zinc finger protein 316-like n=1 Tax=Apodemus sylvaticus TaxID=10129 RepID=UPI002241BBB8|nr:zinc finger protein 316-like [Apodemus sylvaticus]
MGTVKLKSCLYATSTSPTAIFPGCWNMDPRMDSCEEISELLWENPKKPREESCDLDFFKTQNCSWNVFSYFSQIFISVEDVAGIFTIEEWGHLDLDQRTLYQEVMMKTCGLLFLLGPLLGKLGCPGICSVD